MSVQGATVTVAAGGTTASVSFATAQSSSTYQLGLSTSWASTFTVTSKTTTGFAVTFGTAAPAAGGTFDWTVYDSGSASTNVTSAATVTVAAAATSDSPVLALPSTYQVSIAPGWNTAYRVTSKTSSGFTVDFASPAPAGGSRYDYIIATSAGGTVALADYLDELRDLLHDPDDRLWSEVQKVNYINRARRRRDLDTAVNRSTISFTLTAATGTYTFANTGYTNIIDVFSIVLIFGTWRTLLNQLSLTELNMGPRTSTGFTGWTTSFARQGESTVIFGPTPSQAFVTEWDVAVYLAPLVTSTDTDAVSYPYTQPVPYFAAHLAKTNEREGSGEGDWFREKYQELIGEATNQRVGRLANAYSGLGVPGGWRAY